MQSNVKINKYYPNFPKLNVLKHVFNIWRHLQKLPPYDLQIFILIRNFAHANFLNCRL